MNEMHFRPIPIDVEVLEDLRLLWGQFIPRIADRSDETEAELFDLVISGRVQVGLIWDGKTAHALIGIVYRKAGRELIAEVHWAAGFGVKNWQHLLPEIEQYVKGQVGCTIIKPICRPGWKRLLKQHGYRMTHMMMEKAL